ncbi:Retrovirus-related Pol polyprotein from transposon TNT 1-94 [Phytophthora citrophthora]|uniref:Retrovirus-related Pol polyprotein from transposon TNT 1-94 n=1 Tax=Phytophthora citrophthora TaxID=4793 RepID=A0AAD9GV56_9STRA|nr:Retrovirus-related Pol polyprotein from transposon TNT 1-94 [Phytophthora citrophthora]
MAVDEDATVSSDESEVDEPVGASAGQIAGGPVVGGQVAGRQAVQPQGQQHGGQGQAAQPQQPLRRSTRARRPNVRLSNYQLLMGAEVGDLTTLEEAMDSPQWKEWEEAVRKEYESLVKNRTWKLVDRPKDKSGQYVKVVTTGWVLNVNTETHSVTIARWQRRWMASKRESG